MVSQKLQRTKTIDSRSRQQLIDALQIKFLELLKTCDISQEIQKYGLTKTEAIIVGCKIEISTNNISEPNAREFTPDADLQCACGECIKWIDGRPYTVCCSCVEIS